MSTEIPPLGIDGSPLWLYGTAAARGDVAVQTRDSGATVGRAAFLAAVAAECGVIVIDRADLPEVHVREHDDIEAMGSGGWVDCNRSWTSAQLRTEARAHLALAEYLDAHPPVDEADLQYLVDVAFEYQSTRGLTPDRDDDAECIRALLATGSIEVKR